MEGRVSLVWNGKGLPTGGYPGHLFLWLFPYDIGCSLFRIDRETVPGDRTAKLAFPKKV